MKPVTPNITIRNSGAGAPVGANSVQSTFPNQNQTTVTHRPVQGITSPGDIRSNVQDKPLKIPDFLQKK